MHYVWLRGRDARQELLESNIKIYSKPAPFERTALRNSQSCIFCSRPAKIIHIEADRGTRWGLPRKIELSGLFRPCVWDFCAWPLSRPFRPSGDAAPGGGGGVPKDNRGPCGGEPEKRARRGYGPFPKCATGSRGRSELRQRRRRSQSRLRRTRLRIFGPGRIASDDPASASAKRSIFGACSSSDSQSLIMSAWRLFSSRVRRRR